MADQFVDLCSVSPLGKRGQRFSGHGILQTQVHSDLPTAEVVSLLSRVAAATAFS